MRFTSIVFRLGAFGGYSRPDDSSISFGASEANERCRTIVREYFVINGDASIGDNMVDGTKGCHRGRCAKEVDLIVPARDVATDEFDARDRQHK